MSYTARVHALEPAARSSALKLPLPRNWDELFAAGPVFRRALGEGAFPLDGELYDMLLLAQAWVQQKHGTPFIAPDAPRVAMDEAAALDWVRTYQRLVAEHVATPLPLRASLGGAEKPTEQQPDWVSGRWAGNYTWDSVIGLRGSTLKGENRLALGDFPTLPDARATRHLRPPDADVRGRPQLPPARARRAPDRVPAHRRRGRRASSAARAACPPARAALALLRAEGKLPPLELEAHAQIAAQRDAGRIPLPAPLFEHPRMHKFMREVFETVAYGKSDAPTAARRLREDGQALLQRLEVRRP